MKILGVRKIKFLLNFDRMNKFLTRQILLSIYAPRHTGEALRKALLKSKKDGQKGGPELERLTL